MSAPLSLSFCLKIPDGIVHRDLQGELVLLNLNTGVYFGLDHVGTKIWHLLQEGRSLRSVLDILVKEYDVAETKCREDLLALVTQMREKGLVEVHNGTAA